MASNPKNLTTAYQELLRLYKNPTRPLGGAAASNQDVELEGARSSLFEEFNQTEWGTGTTKSALYYKILSLLYEVDDYFGRSFSLEERLRAESSTIMEVFDPKMARLMVAAEDDFTDAEVRSLWKAKVRCCLAAIESRRQSSPLSVLLGELKLLETFTQKNLHKPHDGMPDWTTLALVRSAQARVARHNQSYSVAREKLLSVVSCLDKRAAEIIKKLPAVQGRDSLTKLEEQEVDKLTDDLIFIRQKQTLSILFNVGLADLQRGSLRGAEYACQAARLQFRLHGHALHRLFNKLVLISIRRATTSMKDEDEFLELKKELEGSVLPRLKPVGKAGNPKLYLYGLRELAVVQYYCGEIRQMIDTLKEMEQVLPKGKQWLSRIDLLYSHAFRRQWKLSTGGLEDEALLQSALSYSETAFNYATGLESKISGYTNQKSLITDINASANKSIVDALEALIAYGRVNVCLGNAVEAIKSSAVVIELCEDKNPKLLAMGHLVMAEAHALDRYFVEAHRHLTTVKSLEKLIDHVYIKDSRIAIEKKLPDALDLSDSKNFREATDLLMGWYIEHKSDQRSIFEVAKQTGIDRKALDKFLDRLELPENQHSPYRHLTKIRSLYKKKGRRKQR